MPFFRATALSTTAPAAPAVAARPSPKLASAITFILCACASLLHSQAHAASMTVVSPDASVIVPKGRTTASVRIGLKNAESTPQALAVWFISLEVVADAASVGTVKFSSVTEPPEYPFVGVTPFGPQLAFGGPLPTALASFSDAPLLAPDGVEIAGDATVNLFDLHLNLSPDADGDFRIVMFSFDSPQPTSSSWSAGSAPETPLAFTNSTLVERTLVEISVANVPEPALLTMAACAGAIPAISRALRRKASEDVGK